MLNEIAEWILGVLVGDMAGETLLPGQPEDPPSEGEWNASLGMVSCFLAGLAATFSIPGCILLAFGERPGWSYVLTTSCGVGAFIAMLLARRTLQVTRRRHALAYAAMLIAFATLACSGAALVWSAFR